MRQAAAFRGGKCLAKNLNGMDEKLRWRCTFGHDFEASPRLVLLGGHWCPDCLSSRGDYEEEVKHNAFLAQVWQK
jgi:hypothetical protein